MAGHAVARGVTEAVTRGELVFAVAGQEDEPDFRRLLRENSLGGRFAITLERGTDALASDVGAPGSHVFVIARDRRTGEAIGICERVVRASYVDGAVRALPYLGALRVAESHRRRIAVLRGGFEALRILAERPGDLPFALTSITSDNSAARRVLTADVPGLPTYHRLEDFSSFALRPRRMQVAAEIATATEADLPALAAFLARENSRFQFAPVWSTASLVRLGSVGLRPEHFLLARTGGEISGCMAVCDQRVQRQTVIRRYPPVIAALRPLINLAAPLLHRPNLPVPGTPLLQATLSHVAVAKDCAVTFLGLLAAGLDQAKRRGFQAAIIGFASARPWREALLRQHRPMEYRTTLYLAHRQEAAARVAALRPGAAHPELALL